MNRFGLCSSVFAWLQRHRFCQQGECSSFGFRWIVPLYILWIGIKSFVKSQRREWFIGLNPWKSQCRSYCSGLLWYLCGIFVHTPPSIPSLSFPLSFFLTKNYHPLPSDPISDETWYIWFHQAPPYTQIIWATTNNANQNHLNPHLPYTLFLRLSASCH